MLICLGYFLGYPRAHLTRAKGIKDFSSCGAFVKDAGGAFPDGTSAKGASVPDDYVSIPGDCVSARLFGIS